MGRETITPTMLDKVIAYIDPRRGFDRMAARHMFNALNDSSERGIDALSSSRLRSDWTNITESADMAIHRDLKKLRNIARKLMIEDSYAKGAINRIISNVVQTGITPQSRVQPDKPEDLPAKIRENTDAVITEEKAESFNRQSERLWKHWANSREADAGHRQNFNGLQKMILRTWVTDGECFARYAHKDSIERFLPLCIEVVDPDRVDSYRSADYNGRPIRDGIEIGEGSEAVAYHVLKQHPNDVALHVSVEQDRVPAFLDNGMPQMLHVYEPMRPNQTRGYSPLAPSISKFMDLNRYWEAEIVAARVGACYAAFITSPAANTMMMNAGDSNEAGQTEMKLEPGMVAGLRPGEEITFGNPKRPNAEMTKFTQLILRAIGVALDLPFELIAMDFSQTNYSSARASLLQAYIGFRMLQAFLADSFCQPTWESVITEAVAQGIIDVPGFHFRRRDYLGGVIWVPPGWDWVDPKKEAEGMAVALANGATTLSEVYSKRGLDWADAVVQRGREKEALEELGLWPEPRNGKATVAAGKDDDDKDDEEE